ncbi:uncharacterized protein ACMZJ9_012686 isoform 1-T3 [Mantella aurantiaca]
MLMDVSSTSNKNFDGFYNELRRKYPNTFTIANDLGKGDASVQKLPRLERIPSPSPQGILPIPLNSGPQRWTPDSFLSKVKLQKFQNEQKQEVEPIQWNRGAVIIRDKTKPVPILNKREYLAVQNQASFRLPNLRTQVEQNKTELQNRLNATKKVTNEIKHNQSPTITLSRSQKQAEVRSSNESISTGDGSVVSANVPGPKSDPLGTIMKELLPNKPGRLMTDLPNNNEILHRNGAGVLDSDSGISICAPIKVFRPKIRSPHDAPAPSDIIKKFSAKPKAHSGPMKADHTVLPDNVTQIVNVGESSEKIFLKKSSINYNEKIQQRPLTARVHFEDESEQEAEVRYQERRLLERTHTTKIRSDILPKPQLKSLEKTLESHETFPSPLTAERSPTVGQKTANIPYRRQPFPPNIAKKVLIDIPRSGLPSRRPVHFQMSQAMKDKPLPSSTDKQANTVDGITMSFTRTSQEWKEQSPSISKSKEDNKSHHSFSSQETIGSGITEVSSEVTITTLEWRGSGSSIGSESHTRSSSQNQNLNLTHPSLSKGTEVSFYSKVKKSLQVKMKMSSDTRMMNGTHQSDRDYSYSNSQNSKSTEMEQDSDALLKLDRREKVASHGKSSLHGATSPRQVIMRENESSSIGQDRMKTDVEAHNKDRDVPMKPQFLSMRMMQSLLKKGRGKKYVVHGPSPPPPESRPAFGRSAISGPLVSKVKGQQAQGSARVLAVQSDSSRLVELQRPKTGFRGLYLTQRIQNHHTGLYVVQLSGVFASSFPQGVLEVGDEILEINRRPAKDLNMEEIQSLLEESSCILLRVLPLAHGL